MKNIKFRENCLLTFFVETGTLESLNGITSSWRSGSRNDSTKDFIFVMKYNTTIASSNENYSIISSTKIQKRD